MMPFLTFVPFSLAGRTASAEEAWAQLDSTRPGERRAAMEVLYRLESGAVYRYALALCGNAEWAADATQEAFVALATRPQGFDATRGTLGAYLAGMARHGLAAQWRQARREIPWPQGEDDADDKGEGAEAAGQNGRAASPETLLVRVQGSAQVWAALRRLPLAFCEAVVLVDLQERPYAEAAQIAGIELNTLRTRLHRGRLRLAALLCADPGSQK